MSAVAASLDATSDDNRNLGVLLAPLRATWSRMCADGAAAVRRRRRAAIDCNRERFGPLLARATARHQEIAVRIALGATRGRILTQLVTESLVLAALGGVAGVLLAMWLIGPILAMSPADLGVAGAVTVDRTVLLFGLAASTAAGLLFGLAPAHQLASSDVHGDLKQGARGGSSPRQRRIRAVLVVAGRLSLVLLAGAGPRHAAHQAQNEPPGFNPDHVVTVSVSLPGARYPTLQKKAEFWRRSVGALRQVPGVTVAGAISRLPLVPGNSTRGLTIHGLPPNVVASAHYRTASPDYFHSMEIPLMRGRFFDEADAEGRAPVAIISAAAAQRFWPGRNPLGERFQIGRPEITIVGVAGDVYAAALDQAAPQPTIYALRQIRGRPWCSRCASRTPAARASGQRARRDPGRSTRISRSARS